MDGCMDVGMYVWMYGGMDVWMYGWMYVWMYGPQNFRKTYESKKRTFCLLNFTLKWQVFGLSCGGVHGAGRPS